jgi:nitroreductase
MPAAAPVAGSGTEAAGLHRLARERASCRGFLPDPVDRPVVETVLEIARHAPSWCNTQPWHVTITEGEGTERFRRALDEHVRSGATPAPDIPFPQRYEGAADRRRKACARQLYEAVGVTWGDRAASAEQTARNFTFFGAPHVAIITTDGALGSYGVLDCGFYAQTFLLAAQSLGLGAIPQAALAAYSPFVREHLGLAEDRPVVCGISFGWPDPAHPANDFRTPREAAADTVTWVG